MYLVCYDISSNKYRKKVADILLNYGKRIQYSVFECRLDKKRYQELCDELKILANQCKEDINIRIFEIGKDEYAKGIVIGNPDFISAEPENVIII